LEYNRGVRRSGDPRIKMGQETRDPRQSWDGVSRFLFWLQCSAHRLRGGFLQSFRLAGQTLYLPLNLLRPRPWLLNEARRQGNGTGKLFGSWPISINFPSLGSRPWNSAIEF